VSVLSALFEGVSKRRRGFLWLAVALAVNVLVFFALTHRLQNKQERLAAEEERLKFELQQKKGELETLRTSQDLLSRNAETVETFWSDVVKERTPGLTDAWDEIDRLANEANVVRGRTGYDREILDVGLEQIRATMPLEGSYFDLVRFVNRLERSERFFVVEEIRLSQRESDPTGIRLECVVAFYLKGGAPEASGP
jgi:Tfp pilus assembly protein PilO